LARGDANAAAAALERSLATPTPEALAGPLDEERVHVLRSLGRASEAMATLDSALARAHTAPVRRRLFATRYQVARETGDDALASDAALALLEDYRTFPEAETCALDISLPLRTSGASSGVSTRVWFACADVFAARDLLGELRRVLRVLDSRALAGKDGEHLRILWGEYHYATGDYARAAALARPSYSVPTYQRRSIILLARSLRGAGRKAEAAAMYEYFARQFPNDSLAAEALYTAAILREDAGQEAEYARILDQLRRSYPSSFHGWAASVRRANDLEDAGRVDEAAAIYEQWLARSRRTDEAALFYLSRLNGPADTDGSAALLLDELRRINPYSFYVAPDVVPGARVPVRDRGGSFAAWLEGAASDRERAYRRVLAAAEDESREDAEDETAQQALERGRWFLEIGFRDWAEQELDVARRLSNGSPAVSLVIASTYEDFAMPWQSVRLYERARAGLSWETRREHAEDFRFLTYPVPYPEQVLSASARNEIPPHLIYAIIREESRFETDVVSRAGAVGLMQLMPETARIVASRMAWDPEVTDRLGEPRVNVSIGTYYASDLLRAGDGSVAWMLAAYNAGPGAARRWLEPGVAGDDAIVAVESIDYRETRGYVKRVVESANVYQALYFDDAGSAPR
jgi:soluble lytic murein transglycosylase